MAFTSYSSIQPSTAKLRFLNNNEKEGEQVESTTTVEAYLAETEQGFGALVQQARQKAIEQDARLLAAQMVSEAEAELQETRNEMRRQEERHRREMAQLREQLEWAKRQRAAP